MSATWAVCTLASALSTDAWAEAMLPGEGVVLVVVGVDVAFGAEALEEEEREPLPELLGVPELLDLLELLGLVGLLGTTTVTVTCGVVLVTVVAPGLDFGVDSPGFFDVSGVVDAPGFVPPPGWKAVYSTVPPEGTE